MTSLVEALREGLPEEAADLPPLQPKQHRSGSTTSSGIGSCGGDSGSESGLEGSGGGGGGGAGTPVSPGSAEEETAGPHEGFSFSSLAAELTAIISLQDEQPRKPSGDSLCGGELSGFPAPSVVQHRLPAQMISSGWGGGAVDGSESAGSGWSGGAGDCAADARLPFEDAPPHLPNLDWTVPGVGGGGLMYQPASANISDSVAVPSSEHVAEIVGRQGCKIKALRAKTNTYIKTPVRGEEAVFVVTGRRADVEAAKRDILAAADHFTQIRASRRHSQGGQPAPGHVTAYVRVPYRVVGLVVGPKGATIKRIQQDTHTYIITPSRDREPIFEVTGLPDNVAAARKEIETHIYTRTGNLPLSAGYDGRLYAQPQGHHGQGNLGSAANPSPEELLCLDELTATANASATAATAHSPPAQPRPRPPALAERAAEEDTAGAALWAAYPIWSSEGLASPALGF